MRKPILISAAFATALVSLRVAAGAQAVNTTCATSTVCAQYINTYSGTSGGVAIHGEANGGIGVRGTSVSNTGFYGASGSGNYMTPGVEGESTNNGGLDAGGAFGLAGFATGGKYPYVGVAGFGNFDGVVGETYRAPSGSSIAAGVVGLDLNATASGNAAVAGGSGFGMGGYFTANAGSTPAFGFPVGVLAAAAPTTESGSAIGIAGESANVPVYALNTASSDFVELATTNDLLVAHNENGNAFTVDTSGDGTFQGSVTTANGTFVRTTGASGTTRFAYGAQVTRPQIEDVGEGTLVNGRAVVAIDPDLADSIDMRHAYHVFLTPEGECNGLYVSQKSPAGFVVRELHAGHANLTFDYRIVAKPNGQNGERLARASAVPESAHPLLPSHAGKSESALPTLEALLRERLGPQGYAKLIADLGRRTAGR